MTLNIPIKAIRSLEIVSERNKHSDSPLMSDFYGGTDIFLVVN